MIYDKPTGEVFASKAITGESADFPDILRGWGITKEQTAGKPPMSWMNGAFKRIDENLEYLRQNGIPEWDEKLTYPNNAIVKAGSDFYLSKVEIVGQTPSISDNWEKLFFKVDDLNKKYLQSANAFAELGSLGLVSAAISNLGLGSAATKNVGTTLGTVASGDDFRLINSLNKQYNLADLTNAEGARGNLGLGIAAVKNAGSAPGQIPDMSFFACSSGQNGWQKLPSGIIIQWMNGTITGGINNTISFPIPFPSWFLADAAISGTAGVIISGVGGSSSARIYHSTGSGAISFTAICIGY